MTDQDHVDQDDDEGQSPKFGRLLVILLLFVLVMFNDTRALFRSFFG